MIYLVLLSSRYARLRHLPDLLLALLIAITCFQRTTYTIGFLGWYDNNQTTKINYFLISMALAVGPLIYLYIKSVTTVDYKLKRRDIYHFIPFFFSVAYEFFVFCYDALQPGFEDTQNGVWIQTIHDRYFLEFTNIFQWIHFIVYMILGIELYNKFKPKIKQFYSNVYDKELRWVRNFAIIYLSLFIFALGQELIDEFVMQLNWIQKWYYQFLSAAAVVYVGTKGYFTPTDTLQDIAFDDLQIAKDDRPTESQQVVEDNAIDTQALDQLMLESRPYLDPDLTLKKLADMLRYNPSQLSEIINKGKQMNFNDYVNQHRIEAIKDMLLAGRQADLSLVGIAYECGFNSKATFNRVFKKLTNMSPTQFVAQHKQ